MAAVDEYLTRRTTVDGMTASTANREVDLLKAMLQAAVPSYLPSSPIAGMKRLRVARIRKRVVEAWEEAALLAALRPADRALYLAGVDTLARMGDLLDLRKQDDHGTYLEILDGKTGYYRVPVSARLRVALDALVPDEAGYLFPHRRRSKKARDRRGHLRKAFKTACKRAGIPYGRALGGVTWHTGTRATGATRMLRAGADPATVQAIGHWASLEQMGNYLQTDLARLQAAVNLIAPPAPEPPAPPDQCANSVRPPERKNPTNPDKTHPPQGAPVADSAQVPEGKLLIFKGK